MCALLFAGCEPGELVLVSPDASDAGGVPRTPLTIHVGVDAADSALADFLGWGDGVPHAEINLLRIGTAEWLSYQSDSQGAAVVSDLMPGSLYRLYAGRALSDSEALAAGGLVRAFGDGKTIVAGREGTLNLALYADRRGSLLISEIGKASPPAWEVSSLSARQGGLYFEVYNNGDSTLYLDGRVFGVNPMTYAFTFVAPCEVTEPIRTDSLGVYANQMLQFPGGGTEYPIGPGEVKLVAIQAADHTQVRPTMLDLSHADFEAPTGAMADNPAVPNMVDVGLDRFWPFNLFAINDVYFLSEPLVVDELPVVYRDPNGRGYVRVSRQQLADVIAFGMLWPLRDSELPTCTPMLHPVFDRYEGVLFEIGFEADRSLRATQSVERKILRLSVGGRPVLQNANTSAVDFFIGTRTPGGLPDWMARP